MKNNVSLKILRSIYFAIFASYISTAVSSGLKMQHYLTNYNFTKEATRIINLQIINFHTSLLFKQNSILKIQDKICLENILFVSKSLNSLSPSVFSTWLSFSRDQDETLSSI